MEQDNQQQTSGWLWNIIFLAIGLGMVALGVMYFRDKDKNRDIPEPDIKKRKVKKRTQDESYM